MPRKSSNKTSYVMNLITNGEEEQGQESQSGQALQNEQGVQASQDGRNAQAAQAAAQNTPAAQASVSGAAPETEIKKVVVVDEDQESERLSEEIRGQLELQLEAELKEQADAAAETVMQQSQELSDAESLSPEPMAKPVEPSEKQDQDQPVQESEITEQKTMETVSAAADAKHTAPADTAATKTEIVEPTMDTEMNTAEAAENMDMAAEPAAATENTETAAPAESTNTTTQSTQSAQPGYRMVNVMETLVARIDLDKYINEYGVCPCPRCRADVHALILTTLPSKYVVMDEAAISPMLNFYESRRKTDIFTATLKACLEVKENPRHEGAGL